jgi:thioredoxin
MNLIRCPACGTTNRVPAATAGTRRTVVCGRCKTRLDAPVHPVTVTDATFASEVEASDLPVLLDLWAPWCGPCRMLAPVLEQIASEMAGSARIAKLNVDENPRTAARFGVQSIPTMILFKHGREVDRIVGAYPKDEIVGRLRAIL